MIATSVPFDLVFLLHVIAAVDILIVFIAMRVAGQAVARGADAPVQQAKFPSRHNWAARVLHVLPVSGVILSLAGNSSLSLTKPWIGVGILCYLAAAGHLEARTLPKEKVLSQMIAHDGVASPQRGRDFVQSVDVLLALLGVALIAMLVQS
ncbi:MAG TPA: hypothetical protein VII60_06795 [Acidimicrobiales bacterium]